MFAYMNNMQIFIRKINIWYEGVPEQKFCPVRMVGICVWIFSGARSIGRVSLYWIN